ncbi:MAG: AAA family ATPase [SAR202 cluster bacterium]|nr:AAA family ATPase [SAR202 cluster bacterium]|tara:strand:+ start:8951 stop:9922 length:972 start_codon:yes stop_codon:yes gene_type:complete
MWNIEGHDDAIALLNTSLERGNLAHSYLFVGSKGIGKRSVAVALAQAVNCLENSKPCGSCRSCVRVSSGLHADLRIVTKRNTVIGIEEVSDLLHDLNLQPYEGKYRVVIFDEINHTSHDSFNALLKVLEEPPKHVLFVLLTSNLNLVPETIQSRCQTIFFHPVSNNMLLKKLREAGVENETAQEIIRIAHGRIREALEIASDPTILESRYEKLQSLMALRNQSLATRIAFAEQMAKDFSQNRDLVLSDLALWIEGWRFLLLSAAGISRETIGRGIPEKALNYQLSDILGFLEKLMSTTAALHQNVNPRLALESLLMAIPQEKQ